MKRPEIITDQARLGALAAFDILDTPPETGFDDLVALASLICETPVALVSFVAEDRQWFKARVGFEACETDLNSSVCSFALVEPDLLVIPDLAADPRTAANPLVAGEPHIRFYAGAPLRTEGGQVVGSLCVIDRETRPGGLTPRQATALRTLGRQVVGQLTLRKALAERDELIAARRAADARRRASEGRYATLFNAIDTALCVVTLTFDDGGKAIDYRFDEVNVVFEAQTDLKDVVGRWMRELVPTHEQHWFDVFGRVALTGEPVRFESPASALESRWFEVYAVRIGDPAARQVAILSTDISERRASQQALARSEERLRLAQSAGRIGTFELDIATNRVAASAELCRLFGLPEQPDYPVTVFEDLVAPEDAALRSSEATRLDASADTDVEYRIRRADDGRLRWLARRAQFVRSETGAASRMFGTIHDVTERRTLQEHQAALLELGDRLRGAGTRGEFVAAASDILGRTLRASRAGYSHVDVRTGRIEVEYDWTAPGIPSLRGRNDLSLFAGTLDRLRAGETIAVANVGAATWLPSDRATYDRISVRAQIEIPLIDRDRLAGILSVHQAEPRTWTKAEIDFAHGVSDRTHAALAKVVAEADQRVLNEELSHRLKNSFAMVQAIATQTLKRVENRDAVETFTKRLLALSTAHDVLLQQNWVSATVRAVVETVLGTFGQDGRFTIDGPDVKLGPRTTLSLSLVLHELATNALKYGSLSVEEGRVTAAWQLEGGPEADTLVLAWRENGGPPALPPNRQGFGSRLIGAGLAGTGGVDIRYTPSGFQVDMRAPLDQVQLS